MFQIEPVADAATLSAYHRLRARVFVEEQGLFNGHDRDGRDADPRTVVLVARDRGGRIVGGVRLGPPDDGPDLGWWVGGRLAVDPGARAYGVGPPLIPAGGAPAETQRALRVAAHVTSVSNPVFA